MTESESVSSVTIKTIAEICGVSTTTVSMVINNKSANISKKTRERILKVIEELNYEPNQVARSMVTKRTNNIALLIPDIGNPFFADIAKGVERTCSENGFHVFLCNTDMKKDVEEEYIRVLRRRYVDGMVISTQNTEEYIPIFEELIKDDYPFVFIERYINKMPNIPGVFAKNEEGAYGITEHLIRLGHTNIGFITGPLVTSNARFRLEGYKKALQAAGLPVNPSLIKNGDYKVEGGYRAARELLAEGTEITALFASNDLMAFGAYKAFREAGWSIPEHISIVGFDNIEMQGVIEPKITSMEIPAYDMAVQATRILLSLIEGKTPEERKVYYSLKLIDKGSTAEPPASQPALKGGAVDNTASRTTT